MITECSGAGEVQGDAGCPRAVPHQGDGVRVAAERLDVVADPEQRQVLVQQAQVAARPAVSEAEEA